MIGLAVIAEVLETLKTEGRDALRESLERLEGEPEDVDALVRRYRAGREFGSLASKDDLFLASWLVANVGPHLRLSRTAELEALIFDRLGSQSSIRLVAPKWVLAVPVDGALYGRLPCRPFATGEDETLWLAYEGLLLHLDYLRRLPDDDRSLELMNSSIPWRVIALADRLEPDETESVEQPKGMTYRLGILRNRTLRSDATAIEKAWWKHLDADLVERRNVLSHLCDSKGWSFESCVATPWNIEAALEAVSGIALAVLDSISRDLRDGDPPAGVLQAVLNSTRWLEEHVT